MNEVNRCGWEGSDPVYIAYHDNEWGIPEHNDRKLFEMLILEGMQAGLSWITILRKRENFRAAFNNFDPEKVAAYDDTKITELLQNAGIIRNRGKITAAVTNAQHFLEIQREFGSFDAFIWKFVDFKPIINHFETLAEVPAKTELSDKISAELKKRGFKYVGSTIIYSFMQAVGMVNDHLVFCFCHTDNGKLQRN
ncbi:MAG: DNA-3-methyladenine glycosylase I [Ruminococcaceae bacterium]|nr:DNA-3-methyladenine glycosylase I [Oscillospiraceae bacterium]